MKLQVGERLAGTGTGAQPGGYVVSQVLRETPYHGLYVGRKIQYNFDFASKRVRETDDREWLEVLLRTVRYPHLDDPVDVSWRRRLVRDEVRSVLGRGGNRSWPQPLDLLELDRPRDPFAFVPADDEPVLVLARPHGQHLADWQQQVLPLAAILTVLAETLDLVEQAHAQGWVLQGLGPSAIIVDDAGRTHYLASDLTLDPRRFVAATPENPVALWARLFPADRFPRGFAAPELFHAARLPDGRVDLYAWGWLVYGLLTGHQAWHLALEQGRPWAQYLPAHERRLERSLRQIPAPFLVDWAEQLGLDAKDLLAEWPFRFLGVLAKLLNADPAQRPDSVPALREWLRKPPLPPLRAILAAYQGEGTAQILLDAGDAPGLDLAAIRRWVGDPPADLSGGELVFEGPLTPIVLDAEVPLVDRPIYYAGFLQKRNAGPFASEGRAGRSIGLVTRLVRATPESLARFVDHLAKQSEETSLPPVLRLYARILGPLPLAEILTASDQIQARRWGIAYLRDLLDQPAYATAAAERLDRVLDDPTESLRHEAAMLLWPRDLDPSDGKLLAMLRRIGPAGADDSLRALTLLRPVVDETQYGRLLRVLEGEKPTQCPVCRVQLSARDRDLHLKAAHGYAEVDGTVLPRPLAVGRLWDQTFAEGNVAAHRQLAELLDGTSYATSLERELQRRRAVVPPDFDDATGSAQGPAWRWIDAVREGMKRHRQTLPRLLISADERLRAFGVALGASVLAETFAGRSIDAEALRKGLGDAAPGPELLDERIALARRLGAMGVSSAAVESCLRGMELERPIPCPECEMLIPAAELEAHLRRIHAIHQFRGVRRTYNETREAMLDALAAPPLDASLWKQLQEFASDRHGEQGEARLAYWVCHRVKRLPREERLRLLQNLASLATQSGPAEGLLLGALAQEVGPLLHLGRMWAIELAARSTAPLSDAARAVLVPLFADKTLPRAAREEMLAALLRSAGNESKAAIELLKKYVEGSGKLRGIERLNGLEVRIGRSTAIDVVRNALQERVRMNCPRCGTELQQRDMVHHLWDRHRLVLDGQRVREPWRVLADWAVDYRLEKDPALLERCKDMARRTDAQNGMVRLHRLLLSQGVEDADARAQLLARVADRPASLCPHCFAENPLPAPPSLEPLRIEGEALVGHGYRLRFDDRGMVPTVRLTTPDGGNESNRLPGRWLTSQAKAAIALVPVTGLAFLLLRSHLPEETSELLVALLSLGIALVGVGLGYWLLSAGTTEAELIDAAWTVLADAIVTDDAEPIAWDLLGGLARGSLGKGSAARRARVLLRAIRRGAEADDDDGPAIGALGALLRLEADDAERTGADPVPSLAERTAAVLQGRFPLAALRSALGELAALWPVGRRLRVAVLATERTAEQTQPHDFSDLAQASPETRAFFGDRIFERTLAWHVLYRSFLGGDFHDRAQTIFDLAQDPAEEGRLAERPDVLFVPRDRQGKLFVEREGVWFADVLWTKVPKSVEANVVRSADRGTEFEAIVDGHSLWFRRDPTRLLAHWTEWLTLWSERFAPRMAEAAAQTPGSTPGWRRRAARACRDCGRKFFPIAGGIGMAIDDGGVAERGKERKDLRTE